jgi:2'-5' RNA ligase
MPRLFIAVDLPKAATESLHALSFGIPGAKWVRPEQLHLTVRFIGDVDGGLFHDIRDILAGVARGPFSLQLKGVGCFPPRGAPRVLWVGLEKSEELQRLRREIDTMLLQTGLDPEKRKFSPHITLARLKNSPVQKVMNFLAGNNLFRLDPFQVEDFRLYSSTLTPKGAYHRVERVYPLN